MSKAQKVANIAFVAVISAMLFSVIGYEVIPHVIPGFNAPQESYLEGRKYQHFQKPTVQAFANGDFQASFSKSIADDIPLRDKVIALNAAAQRGIIEIANAPFSFEAYPTFFGARYVSIPAMGRISATPSVQNAELAASIDEAASLWSAFIEKYPDTRWFVFMPDWPSISLVNPVHDLIANPVDRTYWEDRFFSQLPESCAYVDGAYEDSGDWELAFFKTDHHWQIQGAFAAYRKIAKSLGVTPIGPVEFYETDSGQFYGAYARSGLCFPDGGDVVWDIAYDPSPLVVHINGKAVDPASLDEGFHDSGTLYRAQSEFQNVYAEWFHSDHGLIEIENESAETDKTLLIIGESFTNNVERLFAESYRKVYVVDPRLFEGNISQLMVAASPDDALVILSGTWSSEDVLKCIKK